jgi:hypothetical protein
MAESTPTAAGGKRSRILKDYREFGAFNALVNIHAAISEHTFLLIGPQQEERKARSAAVNQRRAMVLSADRNVARSI